MDIEKVQLLSDYTSIESPNLLQLIKDDQGDVHLYLMTESDTEMGIRIANTGSRYSPRVRQALYQLIEAVQEELKENNHAEIKAFIE